MAEKEKEFTRNYDADQLFRISNTIGAMVTKTGHKMSYSLNYNLNKSIPLFDDFQKRLEKAKEAFYEIDENGQKKVHEVKDEEGKVVAQSYVLKKETIDEYKDMVAEFKKETFNVTFKKLDQDKFETAMDEGIFDGIELTALFEFEFVK